MNDILMLTTEWCGDCKRAKRFLADKKVNFRTVDIDIVPGGKEALHKLTGGSGTVPSFLINGRPLVWPSHDELWSAISGEKIDPSAKVSNPDVAVIGDTPFATRIVDAVTGSGGTTIHIPGRVSEIRTTGAMNRIFGEVSKFWAKSIVFAGAAPQGVTGLDSADQPGLFVAADESAASGAAESALNYARRLVVPNIGV
jgi:mycoredoxin